MRVERATLNWEGILEELASAYIKWKFPREDIPASSGDQTSTAPHDHRQSSEPHSPSGSPGPSSSGASTAAAPDSSNEVPPLRSTGSPPTDTAGPSASPPGLPETPPRDTSYDFELDVIDMVSVESRRHFARNANQRTTVALAEGGFLASTPVDPTLAISFTTLEYYRCIRSRKPSFSAEAFAKVVCDLYGVSIP